MKYLIMISIIIMSISGCQGSTAKTKYYVLVVEGEKQMIEKFDPYASIKNPVIEIDYYKSVKVAQEQFQDYNIKKGPVVFIFSETEDKKKKLRLKTKNIEESLKYLRSLKQKHSK